MAGIMGIFPQNMSPDRFVLLRCRWHNCAEPLVRSARIAKVKCGRDSDPWSNLWYQQTTSRQFTSSMVVCARHICSA